MAVSLGGRGARGAARRLGISLLASALLASALLASALAGCATNAPRLAQPAAPAAASPQPAASSAPTEPLPMNPLDDPRATVEAVERATQAQRQLRDRAFKLDADSPLPPDRREAFTGLRYFPFDARYRFVVKLEPCPRTAIIETATTRPDDARRYRCAGVFRFTAEGVSCALLALTPDLGAPDAAPDLFVPFRDATAGKETYAAGRYLQLKRRGADEDEYVLDFNQAFNPYCAYGGNYSCPLPPPENRLPVPIRAGEKLPQR